MHHFYILYSPSLDKYYVGETANLQVRLEQHNSNYFHKSYTKAASDWKTIYCKQCQSKEEALYLEKFVKRMKSSAFIKKVIKNPEILADILNKR